MKTLVAFFSAGGYTASLAKRVAEAAGGNLFRIEPEVPYTDADLKWTNPVARCNKEKIGRKDVPIKNKVENFDDYELIMIGFPVWWYDLPMSMWTFLESYDYSGKTIIPFFSHEGSSNGANALPTVEKLAAGATVRSDDALSIRGGKVDGSESDVRAWVQGLGY